MEELHRQAGELKHIARIVRQQLQGAEEAGLGMDMPKQVSQWLEEAQEIGAKIENPTVVDKKSEDDILLMKSPLSDVVARGKNISSVDFPVETQGIELVWRDDFVNFNSRRGVFEQIMSDLKSEKVGIIGIFGMGGMGKTKLAMEIGKKAKDQKLFNEVVMVTVTQNSNIRSVQDKLADMLNLRLGAFSEKGRSYEIQTKIKTKRNVLVILDNVWKNIDTERIGIPSKSEHNGCKIVITTRRKDVCQNMGCICPISLGRIDEEEALSLFEKHALTCGSLDVKNTVKQIAKECAGLPLAVVTVGSALRDKGLEKYENAQRLFESSSVGTKSSNEKIYAWLKVSYDYLGDKEVQKCFLLCSLYPEDTKVEVEGLTRYAYGHGVFENVESVDQARQKMIASVTKLENACLLSLVKDYCIGVVDVSTVNYLSHVKMHDMVRDVAIWIAKSEGLFLVPASLKASDMNDKPTAVYLNSQDLDDDDDCPQELAFPNLKILIIRTQPITLPANFFKPVLSLQVLDLVMETTERYYGFAEEKMPTSFNSLVNLKVLRVYGEYLRDKDELFKIRNFKKLEILELSFPTKVKVLPNWVGELCSLRVLDLSQCFYLEEIPCNVLKNLAKLEELYTPRYHETKWSHALLEALIHLPSLSVLTGWFAGNDDFEGRKQNMLWSRLWYNQYWRARMLRLDDFNDESMKIFNRLLPRVGCLDIGMKFMSGIKNLCPDLDDTGFQNLCKLGLSDSMGLECLIDTTIFKKDSILPNLVELSLSGMKQLRRICNDPAPHLNFLGNLASLWIENCPVIENLVPDILLIAPKLEKLHIWSCEALKSLYQLPFQSCRSDDAELHTMACDAMLIALTSVDIGYCSNLEEVFPESELNEQRCNWKLAKLAELILEGLPELKCIWKAPQQNYRLLNLKTVYLSKCDKLSSVFTPNLAQSLGKLKSLVISKCAMLETIISPDYSSISGGTSFPELKILCVESCHKLKTVLPTAFFSKCLPKIEKISLEKCEVLEEVFGAGHEYSQTQTEDAAVMLNRISLELVDLPKLVPFSEWTWNQMLTSLLKLKISGTTFNHHSDMVLAQAQEQRSNGMLPIRAAGSLCEMEVDAEGFFSSAEEVFDVKDAQQPTGLRLLKLGNMTKVQYLSRGPAEFINLCNLENIEVHDSPAIKSLFPHSFCLTLHSLQTLKVYNCKELKNIFEPGDHEGQSLHDRCFPKLERLDVNKCEVLESVFPVCVAPNFPCLTYYEVCDCPKLEDINISGRGFHVQRA